MFDYGDLDVFIINCVMFCLSLLDFLVDFVVCSCFFHHLGGVIPFL
jgi:hypothetical protein